MRSETRIRPVTLAEAGELLKLSKTTFLHAFAHLNDPADIAAYAARYFNTAQMELELSDHDSEFYFIEDRGAIIGYLKLNFGVAQTEFKDTDGCEIERIYILAGNQAKGAGQQLLDFALATAAQKHLSHIWLGVWEKNTRAINFYRRNGFEPIGTHFFMLGRDKQTDILMRRNVIPAKGTKK